LSQARFTGREKILLFSKEKIIILLRNVRNDKNNKTVKNGILPLKMELFTLEFRVFWLFF
jgi:hypothetical protein